MRPFFTIPALKNPKSASAEAFAAHLSQIIVDLTWQSCIRMHNDRVLNSSIFEKIITELLCGSRYFFAIAIRFPVIPLVPFAFSSGSHQMDMRRSSNDEYGHDETLEQLNVTLEALEVAWFDNRHRWRR